METVHPVEQRKRFIDQVKERIDYIDTVTVNGKEHKVAIINGKEDFWKIAERVIRNHYLN